MTHTVALFYHAVRGGTLTYQQHYQAIVEHQTELVAHLRPDGTLTFVNDAFTRYVGQPQTAL
jgi:PAS domain-containing protein